MTRHFLDLSDAGRDGLIAFLDRPERAFAMVPGSELCAVHRAFAGMTFDPVRNVTVLFGALTMVQSHILPRHREAAKRALDEHLS